MDHAPKTPEDTPHTSRASTLEPVERMVTSKPKCRVVDFELDDGDADWQDENGDQLEGLGTSTHCSRNRGKPVITVRKHRRHDSGVNVRATARKRKEEKGSKIAGLLEDIGLWEVEREERVHELAVKHSVKSKEVKRMVNEDPTMLEGFTEEEEAEMLEEVAEKRKVRHSGARATNKAAQEDVRRTIDRLAAEIMALAERAGMVGFVFFTCGHIHDRTVPVTVESWGAMAFVREVLRREPSDVQAMFELWAVTRQRGILGGESLKELQKTCTAIITMENIINVPNAVMNYDSYITSIVKKKGYGLVGWPKETEFKCMSRQSAIGPLRALHTALKNGDCHWKKLTPGEKTRILKQFEDMVEKGEVVEKVRKRKATASGSKSKKSQLALEEEEDAPRRAVVSMSARKARGDEEERAPKAAKRKVALDDDDDDEGAHVPPKKKVKRATEADDDNDEESTRRKKSKRTVPAGSDNEGEPERRKVAKPKATSSKKTPAAKKLPKVGVQPARNPGVQPARRPQPTPTWKGAPAKASGSGSVPTAARPSSASASHGASPRSTPTAAPPPTASVVTGSESSSVPVTQRRNVVKGPKGGPPGRHSAGALASE
ncbi:hypothetical protein C8R43DRAFT_1120851 [Mycena crocata]|nr:hypothetical protein C8R43DRAFT_1120851 [Mycena crocata]